MSCFSNTKDNSDQGLYFSSHGRTEFNLLPISAASFPRSESIERPPRPHTSGKLGGITCVPESLVSSRVNDAASDIPGIALDFGGAANSGLPNIDNFEAVLEGLGGCDRLRGGVVWNAGVVGNNFSEIFDIDEVDAADTCPLRRRDKSIASSGLGRSYETRSKDIRSDVFSDRGDEELEE